MAKPTCGSRELELIREYDMLPRGGTVLCAVSGGADSMYLLDRLSNLRAPTMFDFTLVAVHYNHHLRGEESDRDEEFVRRFVEEMVPTGPQHHYSWQDRSGEFVPIPPIRLIVGHGDVAAQARVRRQGVEETARQMRYAFLHETARALGADRIVTAHNADDNLETILLHLVRGTGLHGLSGIAPRQGMLVRPLLATTRGDIEEYLRLYRIPHVEDSSNTDEMYSRNRIRRQVLPLLEGFNPALRENSADTIRYLRADDDYLEAQAALLSEQAVRGLEGLSIEVGLIAQAPAPLAVRALRQLLGTLAGGDTDCAAAHLEAMAELCRSDDPSGEVHLPGGISARRIYGRLLLTRQPPPSPLTSIPLREGKTPIPGTDWTVMLAGPPWPGLVVRPRQTGDGMTLPSGHSRSLKRLFIDRKIPRLERDTIPVVADGDGVIAVAGLGPNLSHPRHKRVEIQKYTEEKK